MGNRAYLLAGTDCQLFEANNSLPLFWLLGTLPQLPAKQQQIASLTAPQLENFAGEEAYEEAYEEAFSTWFTENLVGEIQLASDSYLNNLEENRSYIDSLYPLLSPVYEDFIHVIQQQRATDATVQIIIDYTETINFYSDYLEFYDDLIALCSHVANQQQTNWLYPKDPLGSAIGTDQYANHAGQPMFSNDSYQQLNSQLITAFNAAEKTADSLQQPSLFQKFRQWWSTS
ncbi:hypothetical protein [Enterococcus sp. LJL90]